MIANSLGLQLAVDGTRIRCRLVVPEQRAPKYHPRSFIRIRGKQLWQFIRRRRHYLPGPVAAPHAPSVPHRTTMKHDKSRG